MIPSEDFTDVIMVYLTYFTYLTYLAYHAYLANLAYLTYLTYLIIAKEVEIVKEVIRYDVSPVAMFGILAP